MPKSLFKNLLVLTALTIFLAGCPKKKAPEPAEKAADSDRAGASMYSLNTLGVAYLEDSKYAEAGEAFKSILKSNPDAAFAHLNLAWVHLRDNRLDEAQKSVEAAEKLKPEWPNALFLRAKLENLNGRLAEAIQILKKIDELGAADPYVYYLLSRYSSALDDYSGAAEALKKILKLDPSNLAAALDLGEMALLSGNAGEAESVYRGAMAMMTGPSPESKERFTKGMELIARPETVKEGLTQLRYFTNLNKNSDQYTGSTVRLQTSDYDWPIYRLDSPAERKKPARPEFSMKGNFFHGEPEDARFMGCAAREIARDLVYAFITSERKNKSRLYRFEKGKLSASLAGGGKKLDDFSTLACAFADFDNDGKMDLAAVGKDGLALYGGSGDGEFKRRGGKGIKLEGAEATAAAWGDYDHDGDVDLLAAADNRLRLFRNNLDGSFLEQTTEAGLAAVNAGRIDRVSFVDLNADDYIDLLVQERETDAIGHVKFDARLMLNAKGGRFRPASTGLTAKSRGGCDAGDVNNDGKVDLVCLRDDKTAVGVLHDAFKGFEEKIAIGNLDLELENEFSVPAVSLLDVNSDGFLDLVVADSVKAGVFPGVGEGKFDSARAAPIDRQEGMGIFDLKIVSLLALDADLDGDVDFLEMKRLSSAKGAGRALMVWINEGKPKTGAALDLQLEGTKDNKAGLGAKVEVWAGDRYWRTDWASGGGGMISKQLGLAPGIGPNLKADRVRVHWPNGVWQQTLNAPADQPLRVKQDDSLVGSCPFLYAWTGDRFEFVTDALGASPLGLPLAAGVWMPFKPDEYLALPDSLQPAKNGLYQLRFTEELREVVYLDEAKLVAVDHPEGTRAISREKLMADVSREPLFHTVGDIVRPRAAADHNGDDVLNLVLEDDWKYPANFKPSRYQGLADLNSVTLDFGDLAGKKRLVLILRGGYYWSEAGNYSSSQAPDLVKIPPKLQVLDSKGRWTDAVSPMGFPGGRPKTIAVDFSGKLKHSKDHRVRIVSNFEVFWDQIYLETGPENLETRTQSLSPVAADLHWRGYSKEIEKPGRMPRPFDYNAEHEHRAFPGMSGFFTRYGDVRPLLETADDMYAIMDHGEEVSLSFDPSSLAPPEPGMIRSWFFYSVGYDKDGDPKTRFSTSVEPLPFLGMSIYPYSPGESYPLSETRSEYIRKYNTRISRHARWRR